MPCYSCPSLSFSLSRSAFPYQIRTCLFNSISYPRHASPFQLVSRLCLSISPRLSSVPIHLHSPLSLAFPCRLKSVLCHAFPFHFSAFRRISVSTWFGAGPSHSVSQPCHLSSPSLKAILFLIHTVQFPAFPYPFPSWRSFSARLHRLVAFPYQLSPIPRISLSPRRVSTHRFAISITFSAIPSQVKSCPCSAVSLHSFSVLCQSFSILV